MDNAEDIILEEESPKDSSEMSLEKNETFIIFDQALHSKSFWRNKNSNFLKQSLNWFYFLFLGEPDSLISSDSINGTEFHNMTDNDLAEEFSQDEEKQKENKKRVLGRFIFSKN